MSPQQKGHKAQLPKNQQIFEPMSAYRVQKPKQPMRTLCFFLSLFATLPVSSQTTIPDMAEERPLPAVYHEAYFELQRSFWEGPEKEISAEEAKQLRDVAKNVFKIAPNSIEAAHLRCVENNYEEEHNRELIQLVVEQPGDYLEMLLPLKYLMQEDDGLRKDLIQLEANGRFNSQVVNYHRLLVQWLPRDAIVVTNGFDDTYTTLLETFKQNRTDVFVLTLDLIHTEDLKRRILNELRGDKQTTSVTQVLDSDRNMRIQMLDELAQVTARPVHFALTLPPSWLSKQNGLAQEGLTLARTPHYSNNPQRLHAMALASVDLNKINASHPIARNYLPLLISWHKACRVLGHNDQADLIAKVVRDIAVKTADGDAVLNMLND